jgi:hypothetical protein
MILGTAPSWAVNPGDPEGPCGGQMTGYDGRPYTCPPERRPVCEPGNQRCVCLARTACGAKINEPY